MWKLFKIDHSNLTSTCWQKRITHVGGGCLHHHMTTLLSHIYFVWDMWSLNCLAGKIDLIFWKTRQIVACRACSLAPALKWNKDFFFLRKDENLSFPPPTSNILVPSVHTYISKKLPPLSQNGYQLHIVWGVWYLFCLALTPATNPTRAVGARWVERVFAHSVY